MQRHGVRALFDPVEDDHLAAGELIDNEISQIGVEGLDRRTVGKHDLLGDDPLLGHFLIEIAHQLASR